MSLYIQRAVLRNIFSPTLFRNIANQLNRSESDKDAKDSTDFSRFKALQVIFALFVATLRVKSKCFGKS